MLCLRQDDRRNVYLTILSVKCPTWEPRGTDMPDLGMCSGHPASMVLLPAGERVSATESKREGERCEWEPRGVSPPPPSLLELATAASGPLLTCAVIGGKSAALALLLRRMLPSPIAWREL